jgi:hypothetical protein
LLKRAGILILILMLLITGGCSDSPKSDSQTAGTSVSILRNPPQLNLGRNKLQSFPVYDKLLADQSQVDLRSYDLADIDVAKRFNDLIHADFDTKTKWPYGLPGKFDPRKIMNLGKNPGLNIRKIQKQGITGKGVSIAIIGSAILTNHQEYKNSLMLYDEVHCLDKTATLTGCQAASVAVGQNVGVAPDANLYYIAETPGSYDGDKFITDATWISEAIDKVVNINEKLPKDKKIRVICVGDEISKSDRGYDTLLQNLKRVKRTGIFVISSLIYDDYDGYDDYLPSEFFTVSGSSATVAFSTSNGDDIYVEFSDGKAFSYIYNGDAAGIDVNGYTYVYKGDDLNGVEFDFNGLGRNPLADPDKISSYVPGAKWSNNFYSFNYYSKATEALLVPCDSRTTASPTGESDYVFNTIGSENISSSFIGGLYALACQVKEDITPGVFWKTAISTGDIIKIKSPYLDNTYTLRRIVNPEKLIKSLQEMK